MVLKVPAGSGHGPEDCLTPGAELVEGMTALGAIQGKGTCHHLFTFRCPRLEVVPQLE